MFKFVVTKNVKELFHRAVVQNDVARVKLLLQQASQDPKFHVDTLNDEGLTALQLSCFAGNIELVKLLVMNGANVKIKDCHGWSLLHGAALGGKLDIARFLIEKGCRCSSKNDNGEQPIDLASDLAMIVLLLKTMLDDKQNLAVQQYMKRNPKLKRKIAEEIQTALELENNEIELLNRRPYTVHGSHRRKLVGTRWKSDSEQGKSDATKVTDSKTDPKIWSSTNVRNGWLPKSATDGDLKKSDKVANMLGQQFDMNITKHRNKLHELTGTSHSYCYHSTSSGETGGHRRHTEGERGLKDRTMPNRKPSSTSLQESMLSRKESDVSSLSSFGERFDQIKKSDRLNPIYASIDSTSRRSRSGDSDSSSQSENGVYARVRRQTKSKRTSKVREAVIDEASHLSVPSSTRRETREHEFNTAFPDEIFRKDSSASELSSNQDSQEFTEAEPLYENIPNDILLSIILSNRLNDDAARQQSIVNGGDISPTGSADNQSVSMSTLLEVPSEYVSDTNHRDTAAYEEPIYENLKINNTGQVDGNDARDFSSHGYEDQYSHQPASIENFKVNNTGQIAGNDAGDFPSHYYEDQYNYQPASIDINHGNRYNELSSVPEDDLVRYADISQYDEKQQDVYPIYENLPRISNRGLKDKNDNELQSHIRRHLSKHGPHSVSVGSLPNDYFKPVKESQVHFLDDTHVGNHSSHFTDYSYDVREPVEEDSSSLRVFQLVKVEYPEVFV